MSFHAEEEEQEVGKGEELKESLIRAATIPPPPHKNAKTGTGHIITENYAVPKKCFFAYGSKSSPAKMKPLNRRRSLAHHLWVRFDLFALEFPTADLLLYCALLARHRRPEGPMSNLLRCTHIK